MRIEGKTALVTGGASGLGRATAEAFVAAGGSVVVADLPDSGGEEVAEALRPRARFAAADVTSEAETAAAVAAAAGAFGGLHVVVCCAGVGWPGRILDRRGEPTPLDHFESVVRINLVGTYNSIRLAAARMARQEPDGEERGVAIATASVAAFDGQIGQNAYSASKGGVAGMTLPLARDLAAWKIRVATIAPGVFDTSMVHGLPQEVIGRLVEATPHPRRLGRPEEYAALVLHMVENPMINGEVIRLDGALRMPPK